MRRGTRGALAVAAGVLVAVLPATAADAHVEITPARAAAGSTPTVVFDVPNEVATAATRAIEVYPPDSPPVATARPAAVPGWTARVLTAPLATPLEYRGRRYDTRVTRVTWTATGRGLTGSAAGRFPVSLGPLPATDRLVFKVLQRYSDGQVARWIDLPTGGPEPEHPAPVLTVLPGSGPVAVASTAASARETAAPPVAAPTPAARATSTHRGTLVATVAAVLAALAVAGAALAYRRRSRT